MAVFDSIKCQRRDFTIPQRTASVKKKTACIAKNSLYPTVFCINPKIARPRKNLRSRAIL